MSKTPFGPSGEDIYLRTYARIKDDGQRETWPETVRRVVDGNLGLVDERHHEDEERTQLIRLMEEFAILPAGRHLWLSGVKGKQFINNCWVAGWEQWPTSHFTFTFDQLMQGGGVGANYSGVNYRLQHPVELHLVIDDNHPNAADIQKYTSGKYVSDSSKAVPVEDSREGWVAILAKLFTDWSYGGGDLVLDLSRIRASGTKIKTFGGTSSGPEPLAKLLTAVNDILHTNSGIIDPLVAMDIDHAIAECVVSGNVRRSARMSILHWKDPDVLNFINIKSDWSKHWSTNISVEIDDEFFEALTDHSHRFWAKATAVFEQVTKGMLENGEPGFWNSSLSQEGEPNPVTCTNPCGEITLPEWGVCNLGHVNMDYFAGRSEAAIEKAARLMARFLVRATFADIPDEKARKIQDRDRRIGVGLFGFHGWLVKQGIKFSEAARHRDVGYDLYQLKETVREAAREYAHQLRIPEPVKVTTVAPTGTIAKLPGRSEGIHPIFSPYFIRRFRLSTVDPYQIERIAKYRADGFEVEDDLYSANTVVVSIPSKEVLVDELVELGLDPDELLEGAYDISLSDQLAVQAMVQQEYADNAVSYTVNLDPTKTTLEEFRRTLLGYLPFLKGTTVFPVKSRPQSPYEPISKGEYQYYTIDVGYDEECASGACPVK